MKFRPRAEPVLLAADRVGLGWISFASLLACICSFLTSSINASGSPSGDGSRVPCALVLDIGKRQPLLPVADMLPERPNACSSSRVRKAFVCRDEEEDRKLSCKYCWIFFTY